MTVPLPKIDYLNHPYYGGMFDPDPELGARAEDILRPLIDEMVLVEQDRLARFGYRYGYESQTGEDLVRRGVSHMQLASALMDTIGRAASPIVEGMRERISALRQAGKPIHFKTVNHLLSKEADSELWRSVDAMLREMEILEVVRAFFGATSARINSLAMFVNPPNQEWASHIFRDLEVETPPTAGFHVDSNGKCYLKGILYLNDIGPEQGPFGIIPESHLWAEGTQDRIYRRAFDRSTLLARMADERRMFVSLPEDMQVKAEFGGDLIPDSAEARRMLEEEFVSIGPRGMLSLFWPEAIHRGGNVRSGERHALQITLTAQW